MPRKTRLTATLENEHETASMRPRPDAAENSRLPGPARREVGLQ